MEKLFNGKAFKALTQTSAFEGFERDIRLLAVFGVTAQEVIFATNEDHVYGFGRNRFGGLGLGTNESDIKSPRFNDTLSGRQLKDFFWGFEHWIALTASGRCYAWGHNTLGQLGVGTNDNTATPLLISQLSDKTVVQISCGGFHTLAITSDGQLYSWGDNQYGQLGDGTYDSRSVPTLTQMKLNFVSISCGKKHSMALSVTGRVYLWGINGYGQCGWDPSKREKNVGHEKDKYCSNRPQLIPGLVDIVFSKALCGPNHSLLLTSDGFMYCFGENTVGQIGTGSAHNQCFPVKIKEDVKFKDIITNKDNDMSIGISTDDKYYFWGLVESRRYSVPKEMDDCSELSLFEIYAKFAKNKITFKTFTLNQELNNCRKLDGQPIITEVDEPTNCETIGKIVDNSFNHMKDEIFIDDILDPKLFLKNPSIIDDYLKYNIRLFRVFGVKGSKVMFVTIEDTVYGFGLNRDGSLGLGTDEEIIHKPTINKALSGKQLVDIVCGFEHCIGLTVSGHCYGWGLNRYGEVGIGNLEKASTPMLIEGIADLKVVQICCGSYHSMALTIDGDLFAWGYNTFAQLGDHTYNSRDRPTQVMINEKISSISCGISHSLALTYCGKVYLWGCNRNGQLARDPQKEPKNRHKPMCNRPNIVSLNKSFITKAVCGQNHVLLLTTDGLLFSFGCNTNGQVGDGTTDDRYIPTIINKSPKSPKIKDIISHYDNDLSIAVSVDNKIYYWGFAEKQKFLRPKLIPESFGNSLFNIYAKLAHNKVTFKAVDITEDFDRYVVQKNNTDRSLGSDELILTNGLKNDKSSNSSVYNSTEDISFGNQSEMSTIFNNKSPTLSGNSELISIESWRRMTASLAAESLRDSFDKPMDSDLIIKTEDQFIYCHKTIIKIRNKKFWNHLSRDIIGSDGLGTNYIMSGHSSEAFYAFLQYLYGIEPRIDVRFATDLRNMAKLFDEPALEDMCDKLIPNETIDVTNVCSLYKKAITEGSTDLEESCVEFAANNWKNICKSDAFQTMDDKLWKRLMLSIFSFE